MLISVHLPKTAGSSFGASLEEVFGERLLRDYGDAPLHTSPLIRKTRAALANLHALSRRLAVVDCIHGHFLPFKYQALRATRAVCFITWMRDPVERLGSHYHFWQRSYDPGTAPLLHRRVVEEQWSFERFARSPELRDTYAQFLWGFPLSRFAFIGITEHYADDFAFFARAFLGVSLPPHRLLINDEREERVYVWDHALRAEIERIHHRDVSLYRRALALRQVRERAGAA